MNRFAWSLHIVLKSIKIVLFDIVIKTCTLKSTAFCQKYCTFSLGAELGIVCIHFSFISNVSRLLNYVIIIVKILKSLWGCRFTPPLIKKKRKKVNWSRWYTKTKQYIAGLVKKFSSHVSFSLLGHAVKMAHV